jgi:hypothetical protein
MLGIFRYSFPKEWLLLSLSSVCNQTNDGKETTRALK